jgi:hypothetical protein
MLLAISKVLSMPATFSRLKVSLYGSHPRRAFTLFTTLIFMSILVVLAVTLTNLTRSSIAVSPIETSQTRARNNALMALQLAISQLEAAAGPDQRVTARREILGAGTDNPFWTGVWESRNPAANPVWLVPGGGLDGLVPSGRPPVSLVNGQRSIEIVTAPVVEFPSGAFSWFTADEGVKARVGATNLAGRTLAEQSLIRQQVSTAVAINADLQALTGENLADLSDPDYLDSLSRIRHRRQLELSLRNGDETLNDAARQASLERYLDYTTESLFSLSNTWDGGLRKDLSHVARMGAAPTTAALRAAFNSSSFSNWPFLTGGLAGYLNSAATNNPATPVMPNAPGDYMTDPVSFHTAPILTEIFLIGDFIVRSFSGGISDELVFFYYLATEMFNPYTQGLDLSNGTGRFPSEPGDLRIRITGWPEITVRNLTKDLEATLSLPEIETMSNSFNNLPAGEGRVNFTPTGSPALSYNGISTGGGMIPIGMGSIGHIPDTWDVFEIEFGVAPALVVEVLEFRTNSLTPRLIQRFEIQNWGGFTLFYEAVVGNNTTRLVSGVSAMSRNVGNPPRLRALSLEQTTFGIHLKLVDEWLDAPLFHEQIQPFEIALGRRDLRQRNVQIDLTDPLSGDGELWDIEFPTDVSRANLGSKLDFFFGPDGTPGDNEVRTARLFDLPRGAALAHNALNFAQFDGFPYRPLGNTFQGNSNGIISDFRPDLSSSAHFSLNQFFDRFFFSSLPASTAGFAAADLVNLPNGWFVPNPAVNFNSSDLASPLSSEKLLVEGGFNLNSTSVPAWRSMLLNQLPFNQLSALSGIPASLSGGSWKSVFGSRPFSPIGSEADYSSNPLDFSLTFSGRSRHPAFMQGFRELARTGSGAFDFTLPIAEGIVEALQERGRPFASIAEFADSGILQEVLDSIPGINFFPTPGSTDGAFRRIPTRAPAFVSAGDILSSLSARLFARSDTFTVYFFGEDDSTLGTQVPVRVYGEAVVQRFPQGHNQPALFAIQSISWYGEEG